MEFSAISFMSLKSIFRKFIFICNHDSVTSNLCHDRGSHDLRYDIIPFDKKMNTRKIHKCIIISSINNNKSISLSSIFCFLYSQHCYFYSSPICLSDTDSINKGIINNPHSTRKFTWPGKFLNFLIGFFSFFTIQFFWIRKCSFNRTLPNPYDTCGNYRTSPRSSACLINTENHDAFWKFLKVFLWKREFFIWFVLIFYHLGREYLGVTKSNVFSRTSEL